jgi:WD40 repeat protein
MFVLDILSVLESTFDVRSLSFLENGKLAASYGNGIIRSWDLFRKQAFNSIEAHPEAILTSSALGWVYMASTSNRDILFWDSRNGTLVKTLTGHSSFVHHLLKMQNGFLLSASADRTIKVWNSTDWSLMRTFEGHFDSVKCLAELSYDSVASGSEDGEIRIWDVNEGTNVRRWKAQSQPIKSLALLPKQKYLASLSIGKEIKIWNFNQRLLIRNLISNEVIYSIATLKNGDLVSGSNNGHIRIWDVEKGSVKKSAFYGSNAIWCLAVDLKGRLAAGMGNGDIRILNFLY